MKASKFREVQKAFILKQGGGGMPVAEICRKVGISGTTSFNWSKEDQRTVRWPVRSTNAACRLAARRDASAEGA